MDLSVIHRRSAFSRVFAVGLCAIMLTLGWLPGGVEASNGRPADVWALTVSNQLLRFGANNPAAIRARVAITNLKTDERLVGIDFRPATGRLYGVGSTSQLYVIDTHTGFATPVGVPISPALSGTEFGVDFNPTVDRLRIVSDSGQNLRVNPDTGATTTDTVLQYAATDPNAGVPPGVAGAAYTNPDTDPATATELFDIDATLDVLTKQDPPNNGTLNTRGGLGFNVTNLVGFDIGLRPNFLGNRDGALAALQINNTARSILFSIDLQTGRARLRGVIGGDELIRGLAISLD